MKKVKLLSKVEGAEGIIHPEGTIGFELEEGRMGPFYFIEIRVPDSSLEGDAWYDYLDLLETQFEFI